MSNVAVPGSTMNELCQALEVGESITLALPRHLPAAAGLREVASELARLALVMSARASELDAVVERAARGAS